MKLYAFRTTHNLMHGTVFVTRFKWIAKRWVNADLCLRVIDMMLGFFILEIGADGYLSESGKKHFPKPKEIVEYDYKK